MEQLARTRSVAFALSVLAGVLNLAPQPPGNLLSRRVRAQDWEIPRWPSIRLGQVGIVHAREGNRLEVHQLITTPPAQLSDNFRSARPECTGDCCVIAPFDSGESNRLGGQFNVFRREPSTATATIQEWEDGRRALTLDFKRSSAGYCGAWMHLFDSTLRGGDRVYLDASSFSVLTFWVRGNAGHEDIVLKIADARWERKQDTVPVADLSSLLPGGAIQMAWQRAVLPLSKLPPQIDRRRLAQLAFEALGPAEGRIAIKDIAFCKTARPALPLGAPQRRTPERRLDKAMWVWNTSDILRNPVEQSELIEFSQKHGLTDLFVQLPAGDGPAGQSGKPELDPGKLRPLIAALSRVGVRVHALDGAREYALPERHAEVLRTVDDVIRYNQTAAKGEAFYGVHYDIEPYLINGFAGPRRSRLLKGYLTLLKQIAARTRAAGLRFGVDMPFWYDTRDDLTGESYALEFDGARKFVSEHIIDLVDNVGVMDYRTSVFGADGMLSMASGELEYAQKLGKKVFVGIETTELPDEDLVEFEGAPAMGIPANPPSGEAIVLVPDGERAVVLMAGGSDWRQVRDLLENAGGRDADTILWWPVARVTHVPGDKLSFARLGLAPFQQTITAATPEFAAFPSFAGFAIHDYTGYRSLLRDSTF